MTTTTPQKPETWAQEAWDALEEGEQWVVAGLHSIGLIFTNDVWPAIKASLTLLLSQLGRAALSAVVATIGDPTLLPAAVGSALLVTASTSGVTDAKAALTSAETAIKNDPTVQGILGSTS